MKIAGVEITHLTHDSRTVVPGSCFFALPGTKTNGEMYINQAVSKGAVCVVTQKRIENLAIPQIVVPNVREFMSLCAKRFYGDVCDKMDIIAVVGTNGKTTCSYILKHILDCSTPSALAERSKVGIIGTLTQELTTPDPIDLHRKFSEMHDDGIKTVVMEVSAHAIHYYKTAGIKFRLGIFTNLSQDHLDFFESFKQYAQTKTNFFGENIITAVSNSDDDAGRIIALKHSKTVLYSLDNIKNLKLGISGSEFTFQKHRCIVNLPGKFNVYNALACITAARELGILWKNIKSALKTLPMIPGRFNTFKIRDFTAVVDFAHTPDGLEKILVNVREFNPARIICVFGGGGNRDKSKREIMGVIAAKHSDFVVVTSDNPRFESPRGIILQIEAGVKSVIDDRYKSIEDRKSAVHFALDMAKAGDVVVIAGKGGEKFTEINGKKIPYSDENVIEEYVTTQNNKVT